MVVGKIFPLSSKECLTEAVALAGALSNATRLAILERLAEGPRLVGEIAAQIGLEPAVVSKQLGLLRTAGLLKCSRDGRCREYELADPAAMLALMDALRTSAKAAARNAKRCREMQGGT